MKLEWKLAREYKYRQECWLTGEFALMIEPEDKSLERYRVAIMRQATYSQALYRSNKTFTEVEAKREAIRQGARIARREASVHTEIADCLKRAMKEVS